MQQQPQLFGIVLLAIFGLVGFTLALLWRQRPFRIGPLLLALGVLLFIVGALLVSSEVRRLHEYSLLRHWQTAEGVIVSSRVIGERARRPQIVYEYTAGGSRYIDSTSLDPPNFGGRNAKREAAEGVANEYPAGKPVTIHYNPANPADSRLKITPPWSVYGKSGFGGLLFGLGLFLAVGYFTQRPTKPGA